MSGSPISRNDIRSSGRSNRARRMRRRPSSLIINDHSDSDNDREDSSPDELSKARQASLTTIRSKSIHSLSKREQKNSSSSDDGNLSSECPRSSDSEVKFLNNNFRTLSILL